MYSATVTHFVQGFISTKPAPLISAQRSVVKCYACTTINAEEFLNDVQDRRLRKWLENIRFVPQMKQCADEFDPEKALRAHVKRQTCDNGICMKMSYKANNEAHIWRSCLFNVQNKDVLSECTQITSSKGITWVTSYVPDRAVRRPLKRPETSTVRLHRLSSRWLGCRWSNSLNFAEGSDDKAITFPIFPREFFAMPRHYPAVATIQSDEVPRYAGFVHL